MFSENLLRVQKETNDNRFEMNKADTPLVFFLLHQIKISKIRIPRKLSPHTTEKH